MNALVDNRKGEREKAVSLKQHQLTSENEKLYSLSYFEGENRLTQGFEWMGEV